MKRSKAAFIFTKRPALCLFFILTNLFAGIVSAQEESALSALTGKDWRHSKALGELGLVVDAWLSMGGTYQTDNPGSHSNAPVTFNDRSGEFQFNQLYFSIEKPVDRAAKHWNFGGKVDLMFGTDSRFTQASGLDNKWIDQNDLRFYDLALPQAYLEVFAPIGRGITAKIGHFYTILGEEVVTSPNNFFYSHSYTMQYGEPFTHTGVVFSYALNENFTLNAGSVMGWDNFDKHSDNWNFLGDISWTNDEATDAVSWSVISGDNNDASPSNRTLSSLVVSHSFTKKLQYVFQQDLGYQERNARVTRDAYWYGVNQYLIYDFTDSVSAGLRGEWFRDANGTRVIPGKRGNYFGLTAGLNWKPQGWMILRPEIRYDWADTAINPYSDRSKDHQLAIAMDVVIAF